jgi:hypothetical protein
MEQSYAINPFEAYREAFAPVQRVQQEGLKVLGRFARFQLSVAGALLEHNLAGVQAMMSAATPMEYFARQSQLNARFVEKVATHTRESLEEAADRSVPESAASTNVALPEEEEVMYVDQPAMHRGEDAEMAAQLLEAREIPEEPPVESIEAQPDEPSTPKATAVKQDRKRSDRSRRGQAQH